MPTTSKPKFRGRPRKPSLYADAELDVIIAAGGGLAKGKRRNALRDALDCAVRQAAIHEAIRKSPAPLKVKDFEDIAKLAAQLLSKLSVAFDGDPHPPLPLRLALQQHGRGWAKEYRAGVPSDEREHEWHMHGGWPPEGPRTPDIFGEGEDLALYDAVRGVQRLRTWAALEAKRRVSEPQPQESEGDDNTPWRGRRSALIGRFADVYKEFFGRPVGWGRPAGDLEGPGIEFLRTCLFLSGDKMKPGTIVRSLSRLRSDRR